MTYIEAYKLVQSLNLKDDKERLDYIYYCKDSFVRRLLIQSLDSDALKIKFLDKLSNDSSKAQIINSLSNDKDKFNCALNLKDDFQKSNIVASLSNDSYKTKLIDTIQNDFALALACVSLSNLEYKLSYLSKMDNLMAKNYLVDSMYLQGEDLTKSINYLSDDIDKALIINTIFDKKLKLSLYKQLKDDTAKSQILINLHDDAQKLNYLDDIKEPHAKALVISTLADNQLKLKLLNLNSSTKSKLILPPEMTFGIEIECEGKNSAGLQTMRELLPGWKIQREFSLNEGTEITSPILTHKKGTTDDIALVCNMLKTLGQTTSDRCGGHIHIGKDYLKGSSAFINLLEIWAANEKILYLISNQSNNIPRPYVLQHAKPVSKKIEKLCFLFNLRKNKPNDMVGNMVKLQRNRNYSVNFQNLSHPQKKGEAPLNTIEFRLSNGSLSPDTWIENINLFGSIFVTAKKISDIRKKPISERTSDDLKSLELFNKMKQENLSQTKKLNLFLNLCLPPSLHHIYVKRYNDNKARLAEKTNFNKRIDSAISTHSINFRADEINQNQNNHYKDLNSSKEDENVR